MQKKLIALAVAGLVSAPAFAQSNVTVYGIVDMFVGHSKAGDTKATDVLSGGLAGSRLGFKGTEDLGNGMKALFTLEYGISPDVSGGGLTFTRQSFVGLSGNFGTVTLGRQYAPGYYATAALGAVAAGPLDPIAVLTSGLGIAPGSNARWENAVNYASPSFGGFSAQAIYSFSGKSGDGTVVDGLGDRNRMDSNDVGLGLTYANGPLDVRYVYQAAENLTDVEQDEHLIGASYNFGVMKLTGSYQIAKFDYATSKDRDVKVATIGGIIPVGAGNVHVSIGKRWDDNSNADAKSYGLAYTHGLSKRTTVFAGMNRTSNDDNAAFGSVLGIAGENETAFAVGVNHKF